MNYIRDLIALSRWTRRKARQGEAAVYSRLTPEGQKRYRRWKPMLILLGFQYGVLGRRSARARQAAKTAALSKSVIGR